VRSCLVEVDFFPFRMVRLICRSCLGSFRFFAAKYTVVDKEGEVADMGR
jgi:hypothetical protein